MKCGGYNISNITDPMKYGGYNVTNKIVGTVHFDLGGCRDTTEYSSIQQRLDVKRQVCGSAMRYVISELGCVHLLENSSVAIQLSVGTGRAHMVEESGDKMMMEARREADA